MVEPKLLNMVGLPPIDWRDKELFHLPSFRVASISARGPNREFQADRSEGHWRIVRPFAAVGDDDKVEGTVAELTSLRVAKGKDGFVADDVAESSQDAARFGLFPPELSIVLTPVQGAGKPQTLHVGAVVPDQPDLSYARLEGQNDVVMIDVKNFRDLGKDVNAWRSQQVAYLNPGRVNFVKLERLWQDLRAEPGRQGVGAAQAEPRTRRGVRCGGVSQGPGRGPDERLSSDLGGAAIGS